LKVHTDGLLVSPSTIILYTTTCKINMKILDL